MNFRPMLEADADAVRRVDTLAFTPLFVKTGAPRNAAGEFPLRTRENILAGRAIFPDGCFVADAGDELAGYVFSRAWGSVGWVGVFGIHPNYQGQRVGQQLLAHAVDGLRSAGCTTIGLETIPDSYYNIGLYARQGFRPITMTFALQTDALQKEAQPGACRVLRLADEPGLNAFSQISRTAWQGLDLRAEAVNALTYGWGQSILVGADHPYAAAVARVVNRREDAASWLSANTLLTNTLFEITSLAALPEARSRLVELVNTLEGFAAQQGFKQMRLILNSADWQSMQSLLANGYRVVHSSVRLMLSGDYGGHPGLEFSRWAM